MKAFKDWVDQQASEMAEHLEHVRYHIEKDKMLEQMVKGRLNAFLACKEKLEDMTTADTSLVDRETFFKEE